MPTAGIGHDHIGRGEAQPPARKRAAQGLVDEVHHRRHDFRRRVIGAGPLAQRVVVDLQEVLVEIEPRFRLVLADRVPIHLVKDARQRSERGLERLLIRQGPRSAAGARSRSANWICAVLAPRLPCRRPEKYLAPAPPEVRTSPPAHSRRRIVHRPPAGNRSFRQSCARPVRRRAAERHLLDDFIAQKPAKARADLRELLGGLRRDRRPAQKIVISAQQRVGRL